MLLMPCPAARAAYGEETFADKTWDEVVAALMEEYNVSPESVSMGYCNTVTGETHYYRGDAYMVAASMYKVPLNMVFAERISKGEMDWDTPISGQPYSYLMERSIIKSDNDAAEKLWIKLGGYKKYRKIICPLMGADPDTVDKLYWKNNLFTAEQMIYCLSLLQANPERFPRLEETMKLVEPERYFNYHKQEFEIAHKYGFLPDETGVHKNDCAICYTDDPICIVLFTCSAGSRTDDFMADFCTLMCDYTQYHTAQRRSEEEKAEEEAAVAASASPEERALSLTVVPPMSLEAEPAGQLVDVSDLAPSTQQLVLCGVIFAACLAALISVLLTARKGKISGGWGTLTVLLVMLALWLCVMAPTVSELLNKPKGDPRDAASGFFDALIAENYDEAYTYLNGYSSLGLEKEPENEVSRMVFDALRSNYSYTLRGDCTMDKTSASQKVLLQHLDLNAFQTDLKQATEDALARKVQMLPRSELYDESGAYLPEVTTSAYADAVASLLMHLEDYMTVSELDLKLIYTADGWKLELSQAMSAALCGLSSVKGGV